MRRSHLISASLGLLAAGLALMLTPASSTETAIGRVDVSVRLGDGGTYLDLPPLGSVVADTHVSPIGVHVELGRLELREIGARMESDSADDLLDDTRGSLAWGFIKYGATLVLFSVAASALLAAATRGRSRRRIVETIAVSTASLVALGGVAALEFKTEAFRAPAFNGPIREAPDVLRRFDTALEGITDFTDRLDAITAQLATLAAPMPEFSGTTILHVSDLHSNPLGVLWVNEIVDRFSVDAVVDTGDITSFGYVNESAAIEQPLNVPRAQYYVVFGNHDAPAVRERLTERLTPLHAKTVAVAGIEVLGIDDPTYTVIEGTGSQFDADYDRTGVALSAQCRAERPLVVAVHNPVLAQYVAHCAAVVISGHLHETRQERLDGGALLAVVGSTGAGGVEGIAPDGVYEAQLLRFTGGRLVAIDVLTMNPTTGEFLAQRIDPTMIK